MFPRLVPTHPDDPGAYENRVAIEKLRELDLPVFLAWGEEDADHEPGRGPAARHVSATSRRRCWIPGAGHFIQEDAGEEVATKIRDWMRAGAVTTP